MPVWIFMTGHANSMKLFFNIVNCVKFSRMFDNNTLSMSILDYEQFGQIKGAYTFHMFSYIKLI